jgi:hypothetical protein
LNIEGAELSLLNAYPFVDSSVSKVATQKVRSDGWTYAMRDVQLQNSMTLSDTF